MAQQQKEIEALTATVKEQSAQIQEVSTQLEPSKSAPQTVPNNQQHCQGTTLARPNS